MATNGLVKVANQVWVALALLHLEHPEREAFTPGEAVERVRREFGGVRPGVLSRIYQHGVAAKEPRPGRCRILHAEEGRRLFRPGNPYHPDRQGGKVSPRPQDLPPHYPALLRWYQEEYSRQRPPFGPDHPPRGRR